MLCSDKATAVYNGIFIPKRKKSHESYCVKRERDTREGKGRGIGIGIRIEKRDLKG